MSNIKITLKCSWKMFPQLSMFWPSKLFTVCCRWMNLQKSLGKIMKICHTHTHSHTHSHTHRKSSSAIVKFANLWKIVFCIKRPISMRFPASSYRVSTLPWLDVENGRHSLLGLCRKYSCLLWDDTVLWLTIQRDSCCMPHPPWMWLVLASLEISFCLLFRLSVMSV